ncbi:MAG: phosphatase PAP2 family protein [Pontibacterium sp.]
MNALVKLTDIDTRAFYWCLGFAQMRRVGVMSRAVSKAGDGVLYVLVGIALLAFEPAVGIAAFFSGIIAFSMELPAYFILKNTIRRDRPCYRFDTFEALIVPSDKFSFPSGHSAAAFVFATTLSHYYPSGAPLFYGLASMIGLSRVLLGVHFPSDIVAGAALGMLCATFGIGLYQAY